jgi:transcriptional regulator with XRE-family HTH domain
MINPSIHLGKDMAEIGLFVKMSRTKLGLTQADLAKRVFTDQQFISKIESGKLPASYLQEYAEVFVGLQNAIALNCDVDSPARKLWREMLLREIKRQFDSEDLRYTIYSHNLVTPEMWQSGCQIEDVGALIKELNDRGELVAITMDRDTRSPQWWVIRLVGGDTLDANVLEDAIDG